MTPCHVTKELKFPSFVSLLGYVMRSKQSRRVYPSPREMGAESTGGRRAPGVRSSTLSARMSSCSDSQWSGGQKLLLVSLDFSIFTRLVMTCGDSRTASHPGAQGRRQLQPSGPGESACASAFMRWPGTAPNQVVYKLRLRFAGDTACVSFCVATAGLRCRAASRLPTQRGGEHRLTRARLVPRPTRRAVVAFGSGFGNVTGSSELP